MRACRSVKGGRAKVAGSSPTPIQSTATTPVSSAHPSAYPSEVEWDAEDFVSNLTIGDLTLDVPLSNNPPRPKRSKPFPFLSLPSELRIKIYDFHFASIGPVVDLEPGNYFRIHNKLAILRTCRTIYIEASQHFYSTRTFRIFPTDGRYSRSKKTLLTRLKPQSRAHLTSLELRLGPGFNKPYRSWVVNSLLGLKDCTNVRRLCVFVEIDPSHDFFNGFRKSTGFYETFSRNLLNNVLEELPHASLVQFDANLSVQKAGDMMQGLLKVTRAHNKEICWGPERGWTDAEEVEADEPVGPSSAIRWEHPTPAAILSQGVFA